MAGVDRSTDRSKVAKVEGQTDCAADWHWHWQKSFDKRQVLLKYEYCIVQLSRKRDDGDDFDRKMARSE